MRPPIIRAFSDDELVVDNFAGGGGASTGMELALGRSPDIAINHSAEAIAMHKLNHPSTKHFIEDIWEVDPKEACGGRPVGIAWFSLDCTHFSRAKGNVPRSKDIRGLAWVVIRWAREVGPRIIVLENVEEFQTWGPLDDTGRPDHLRAGETFQEWLRALATCGYTVEFKSLVAADYGTPTTRRRLFLVARRDGASIVWPEATHGKQTTSPWHTAAEVIDWSIDCPSIFERRRPLADATLRRIAAGIRRYVLDSGHPFIVPITHRGDDRVHGIDEPVRTVTAAHRGELALVSPTLVTVGYGERIGQSPRVPGLDKPLGTIVAQGRKHALVAAFLTKHFGGVVGQPMERPAPTVTSRDHTALSCAFLSKFYGTSTGSSCDLPLPTVLAGGDHGGGHLAAVKAFLIKFYKSGGQWNEIGDPLHTVTAKGRFGLVTVAGEDYQIVDVGMRMLQPHELYRAQGFPETYDIEPVVDGKTITKTTQIALAGNAVCPQVAAAVVAAQVGRAA